MEDFSNWYLYVVVNNELASMNHGKAEAHSGHAASQFAWVMNRSKDNSASDRAFKYWNADRGFGTQINLKPKLGFELDTQTVRAAAHASKAQYECGYVVDPTYPYSVDREIFEILPANVHTSAPYWDQRRGKYFLTRSQTTAFWIFCDKTDPEMRPALDNFKLKP